MIRGDGGGLAWALGLVLVLTLGAGGSPAPSPWVGELRTWFARYHEDPPRLDAIREGLRQATRGEAPVEGLLALAQVSFLWGDVRAAGTSQKLVVYDEGRRAAQRATVLAPRSAAAHFWFATNTARWGQAKGIVRSLFLLGTVQEEIRRVLDLDPGFTAAYALAGHVYLEVPSLLGGPRPGGGNVPPGPRPGPPFHRDACGPR